MSTYSNVGMLGQKSVWNIGIKNAILTQINNIRLSLATSFTITLEIPENILGRIQLLVEHISEASNSEFNDSDFIYVIYKNFLTNSTLKYDPHRLYKIMNNSYGYNDTIRIVSGNEVYEHKRVKCRYGIMQFILDKKDYYRGELLLAEIKEKYGLSGTVEEMITNLLIAFIETYKVGEKDKVLNAIIEMARTKKKK